MANKISDLLYVNLVYKQYGLQKINEALKNSLDHEFQDYEEVVKFLQILDTEIKKRK